MPHLVNEDLFESLSVKKKRTQSGITTSDLILSSHDGDNTELFQKILDLHVPKGSKIADVTFGTGVFWKKVCRSDYKLIASDLKTGVDCRMLPYEREKFDALVLDPPYMEGLLRDSDDNRAGGGTHKAFREYYSNGKGHKSTELKYHARVIDLYMKAALEAKRVLKPKGILIIKCQDEVSANRQKLTHVELIYGLEQLGFYCKDLFVLTRHNKPVVTRLLKQEHARKNHSYFLIFIKQSRGKLAHSNFSPLLESYTKIMSDD
jgi:hypothetical protein